MSDQIKRTTIYLDADLYKALRLKSVEASRTMSDMVNEAVKISLAEDAEDILAFEEMEREPLISYEEMVKKLKIDGRI